MSASSQDVTRSNLSQITEIGTVFVPVVDREHSLDFFVEQLGFEKRVDYEYGGGRRWIEVAPAGASNTISLVPTTEGPVRRDDRTYCAFATTDIEREHRRLHSAGVSVDPHIARAGTPRSGLLALTVGGPGPCACAVLHSRS